MIEPEKGALVVIAIAVALLSRWFFWFSAFIGRVEALEAAAKETAEEEENG